MRFQFSIVCLALAIVACSAEAPSTRLQRRRPSVNRFQRLRQPVRTRFFARQEIAPTPYPAAEDIKPAAGQPELVYGPPEQTYGPPQQTTLLAGEQLPAAETPQEFAPNPDAEEFSPPAPAPARVTAIQQQLQQRHRQRTVRPIKLQAIQPQPLPLPQFQLQSVTQPQPQPLPQFQLQHVTQPQFVQSVEPVQVKPAPQVFSAPLTVGSLTAQPSALPLNAVSPIAAPASLDQLTLPTQQYYVLNQPFSYTAQYQAW